MNLLITCEHGGNQIPAYLKEHIYIEKEVLNSHLGYDLGALDLSNYLYNHLKKDYSTLFLKNEMTRLLIDFNRSIHHPKLFSKYSKHLSKEYKEFLLKKYHEFRKKAKDFVIKQNHQPIIHLSIHSFTPVLNNKIRKTEIGILFDPKRKNESYFAKHIKKNLSYRCHFNLPYRGVSDGHTQSLRTLSLNYVGIEIEINQKFLVHPTNFSKELKEHILTAIKTSLKETYRFFQNILWVIFLLMPGIVFSQNFIPVKKQIDGELHLLRNKIETPIKQQSIYDVHFREYLYSIRNGEMELHWEENYYNNKKSNLNWSLLIPIDEQSYLHYIEANSLWEQKKAISAIFLWKSLLKSKNSDVAKESYKTLQEKLKNQKINEIFRKIDPYFLYNLTSNKTQLISEEWGITLTLNDYWYFYLSNVKWFYFIEIDDNKRILLLNNSNSSVYIYLQKTRENQVRENNDVLYWVDTKFSWNFNTKQIYSFQRQQKKENIYFVTYKRGNQTNEYYEKIFLFPYGFCYLRIYSLNKDQAANIIENIKMYGKKD